jgi:hypothetical protein
MLTVTQIASIIMLLQAFGVDAQTIAAVRAEIQPTAAIASPTPVIPTSSSMNYSTYAPVSVAQYIADPLGYLSESIVITGMVNTLMPRTGSGGTTNYVQIMNPFDQSEPKVQLEIDNNSVYSTIANSLQDDSSPILQFVQAYGIAIPNQAFTATNFFGTRTVMLPTIEVTRVDKCLHGSMKTVGTSTSFDDNFTCTAWATISGQ